MKKKYFKILVFILFLISILGITLLIIPVRSASLSYQSWSDLYNNGVNSVSYSTVYLTEKTRFKVFKNGETNDSNPAELTLNQFRDGYSANNKKGYVSLKEGEDFIMLITNCAVNANGEMLDILIKIDNVVGFTNQPEGNTPSTTFGLNNNYTIPTNQKKIGKDDDYTAYGIKINYPLPFNFVTNRARADFTMTYYIHNTYDYGNNRGTLGNISEVNGMFWDIDVIGTDNYCGDSGRELCDHSKELFDGNEGIKLDENIGTKFIYYNKNGVAGDPNYKYTLQELDGGIAIKEVNPSNADTNHLYFQSSTFISTSGLNSTYKFTYSGRGCGITYSFISPYSYATERPTKKVVNNNNAVITNNNVNPGSNFKYIISQYIPNNYFGEILSFNQIFDNISKKTRYNNLVISDTIDNNLTITGPIEVTNESKDNVTYYFDISTNGNKITATVKNEYLQTAEFYAHTYNVEIPVELNLSTSNVNKICNYANNVSTRYSICENNNDCPNTNLNIPEDVCVNVKYSLTVNYYENGTKNRVDGLAADVTKNLELNAKPNTNYSKVDLKKWQIVDATTDAKTYTEDPTSHIMTNVNIEKDTEVNYYFEKHKYKLTVNYLEEGTNTKIDNPRETVLRYGDGYSTDYNNINLSKWQFVKTDGDPTNGTITGDTVVNYYFKKIPYTLTVNYFEKNTHTPIDTLDGVNPKVTQPIYYDDHYDTNYNNVNLKKWRLVGSDGDATSGTIKGNTTVNYYFEKIPYTLTVNYLEEGTNKPVDNVAPDVTNPIYYDDHYTTKYNHKVNLKKWRIVRSEVTKGEGNIVNNQTKITEGTIVGDTTVNYYFEKIPYTLTVNYYEECDKEKQDCSKWNYVPIDTLDGLNPKITHPIYYDDEYETNYNNVNLKKWRIIRSEVNITEDTKVSEIKEIDGILRGDTIVNYYFEKIPYPVIVNYYDTETHEKIDESDKTIYYYDMLYYTDYDKINMEVWEYVSTDGDPVKGKVTGDQESYTINYYFNRLKYQLTVNFYDDETKEKIAKSERSAYNFGDEYDTNYDKIDENLWEYVRTEGETPGVINEDKEVDYYFNNKEYTLEVNYYDEETGEKIEETDITSHKYGDEYTTNDDKIDKKKWELVEEPKNKEGTVEEDTIVNYYYRKRKYKITVNYYEEGTENKIIESREYEAYYEDKYITDYNGVDGDIWTLVEMPENYQGEVDGDIIVNYYFKQVVIENPPTGESQNNVPIAKIIITISIILVSIIFTYRILLKKKIYKV